MQNHAKTAMQIVGAGGFVSLIGGIYALTVDATANKVLVGITLMSLAALCFSLVTALAVSASRSATPNGEAKGSADTKPDAAR